MRPTRPLFHLDPGWPFIIAGLVMMVACVIIPPQKQLHTMHEQVTLLQNQETAGVDRLRAYSEFIARMDEGDTVLTRRLAAAQLNLVPAGDLPVLIAGSASAPVTDWIESTIEAPKGQSLPFPDSELSELVTGRHRHWVLGGAAICLFVGLLLGPGTRRRSEADDAAPPSDQASADVGAPASAGCRDEAVLSAS